MVVSPADATAAERRFGALRRLWGDAGYARVRRARIAVVGVGGVGSWAAEALARSGVAGLVLIDLDHVAESNINRQVQALGSTLGAAKVQALRRRIADIHPDCEVTAVEEFVTPDNWPALLPEPVDVVIDACDQGHAKLAMAHWACRGGYALVCAGAAGGKSEPQRIEVDDLALVTHDPLLAALRQRLRKLGAPSRGRIGVRCVFSREPITPPVAGDCARDSTLNCHGYGSCVTVTASFGMALAAEALSIQRQPGHQQNSPRRQSFEYL
ncbi:MAG TPA: tRNA threonylcarbamoyladenosine dehydratase [Lamprocystis sp. (in: g-proteobacteria)]|nr:tRNA threonylcarbamoyladenosine dehydratase [Lamprocystis sp. (in: g-proteobacteria)]